jgi:hypothetical protein
MEEFLSFEMAVYLTARSNGGFSRKLPLLLFHTMVES